MDTLEQDSPANDAHSDAIASAIVVAAMIVSVMCSAFAVEVETSAHPVRSVTYLAHAE